MTTETRQQTRVYVQAAAAVCEDKKGIDTRILELDPIDSGLSDFFLVTSASNDRQAIAIADEIEGRLKRDFGVFPNSVEGRRLGQWILLDYVDFVVHVFLAERRAFYDIERLRKSARPLSPAEFDAELRSALAARTVAARQKASARPEPASAKAKPAPKPKKPAKKAAAKPKPVPRPKSKKAVKKTAVKPASRRSRPAAKKPAVKKKASGKTSAINAAGKKKSPAKKTASKKAPARKPSQKKKKR
jgi:ribosome-associated protein